MLACSWQYRASMFRSLFVPQKILLMLFVKFFREVLVEAIVKPHGLKLACIQNKESHKFNVYQAGFIVIQRYCLQTKVISFDKRSMLTTPCICFSATESSLDVHEEWKYLSSKNNDSVKRASSVKYLLVFFVHMGVCNTKTCLATGVSIYRRM